MKPCSHVWWILSLLVLLGCQSPSPQPPEPAKVPVQSEVIETTSFQADLILLGRVVPSARVELRSPAAGFIRYPSRFAGGLRTGERVARGDVLFEIDNDAAQLHLSEAQLADRLAETELARTRQGVEGGVLPAAELKQREIDAELAAERLENARYRSTRLQVRAPADGILRVDRVHAPGSEIPQAETLVAELLGDGLPRIEAWAAAADRERLRVGLEVECWTPGTGRVVGQGSVAEIAREVDRTGTLRLVVTLVGDEGSGDEGSGGEGSDNGFSGLPLPGEGVELRLLLDAKPEAITVPQESVAVEGGVASIFVLEPSGAQYRARRRLVQTGGRSEGRVEILDGLRPGERVAVRGVELLADGLPATEAETPEEG